MVSVQGILQVWHVVSDCGHPSKYWPYPMLLKFIDQMKTDVFNVAWLLKWNRLRRAVHSSVINSPEELWIFVNV